MTKCDWSRALVLAIVLRAAVPSVAHAQSENQAAARVLFEEGRQLLKAGQYTAACPKLEAASRLYSSAGILLNLGDCYENIGRTASAWTEFGEAASVARRTNRPDDADEALRRQKALDPVLARVVIRVPHPVPGLKLERGGGVLAVAAWGAPLPVDPGSVEIRAEAPGYQPWSTSVVATAKQTLTVEVPALGALAAAPAVPPPPSPSVQVPAKDSPPAPPADRSHVLVGWLIGGGVAVGLGGGALMWVESRRTVDARTRHDPAAYDAAKTPWAIGLASAIGGGAAAATGAYLLMSSYGDERTAGVRAYAWVGASVAGVQLATRW
jgi:hypothetical protein